MTNYKMTVCYDGSCFHGWQKQKNTENTVQGRLEEALGRIMGYPVELQGAGRTDRGVHAAGQVASFCLETSENGEAIRDRLNQYLPESVAVLSVEEAPLRFHARLNALSKTYVYRLWDGPVPNVFQRNYVWQCREVTGRIDVETLNRRLQRFTGEQDFRPFSRYTGSKSAVRTIYEASAERRGDEIRITFRGNGFLYNQVRMMVGWALTGEKYTAPAHGLCLESIAYDGRNI
jgi:tRNA pseudouridine38-40 synthase